MAHKIGVYGSNVNEGEMATALGNALGNVLAERGCIVITGACSGMPYVVAHAAAERGAQIWGFTPELDYASQRAAYPTDDITIYKCLVYVPQNFRELVGAPALTVEQDHSARLKVVCPDRGFPTKVSRKLLHSFGSRDFHPLL